MKILQETYYIDGKDESGLIPENTCTVIVNYDDGGNITGIFYGSDSKKISRGSPEEQQKRLDTEIKSMNPKNQNSEVMGKVVGLLKKPSSKVSD